MHERYGRPVALAITLALLAMTPPAHASAQAVPDAQLAGLEWRLLGPFRGGWGTMATGIPDQPDTFYFGAAGGGVWKTNDAGATWQSRSDGLDAAPIGAIAIAPSNPNVIYAGSGHPEPRYDIAAGDGLYKSTDGGAHWSHAGLAATRHIGAILVDAKNPDTVLVGALGHIFGPNPERGVFRSIDGGRSWTRTLFVDDSTGVVDLAADPAQPNLVFAAAWTARNWPWLSYFTPIVGAGSAIYKSADGGVTWQRLGGEGWPAGELGRIGLGVTHLGNGATRIYASIDSADHGGLYRSDDGGGHWQRVNDAKAVSTWYESRLTVAPDDPDTLYTVGQSIHKSSDAGKTFTIIKGAPGGDDYHHLWINPKNPQRMITASDQGTVVSVDGGRHWSDWYNQPTGQFYHLAADNRFPYWIYSGQQDSGTVGIASRSDYGAISFRDWHPVGGDERDYDLPDPDDANIVYGSGLGGRISRWDSRTGEVQNVSPWPVSSYGARGTEVKYRYTWFTPIAFSAQAPYALYSGSQVLFRSLDKGRHWDVISPDLTGKRDDAQHCDGDVPVGHASVCGYGVIFSIAPSPHANDEIWIGTDNGRVQLTRDGGRSWNDVTPKSVSDWAKISSLDVSALDAGTAYAAVDNHRQDDFRPRILRTHDYGRTWSAITNGLPDGHFVSVVR
ncbi:MAG: WD40/YVTN/BNR-like repeat-containing protein, partial [Lysobacterales bacterium]